MCVLAEVALVVSNFVQSYELYPTRLLSPLDSSGRNTRVGCYGLLQGIEPVFPESPALQADSLTPEPQGEAPQRAQGVFVYAARETIGKQINFRD